MADARKSREFVAASAVLRNAGVDTDKVASKVVRNTLQSKSATGVMGRIMGSVFALESTKQVEERAKEERVPELVAPPAVSTEWVNVSQLFNQGTLMVHVKRAVNCVAVSGHSSTVVCSVALGSESIETAAVSSLHPVWNEVFELEVSLSALTSLHFTLSHKRPLTNTLLAIGDAALDITHIVDGTLAPHTLELDNVPGGYSKSRTGPTVVEVEVCFVSKAVGSVGGVGVSENRVWLAWEEEALARPEHFHHIKPANEEANGATPKGEANNGKEGQGEGGEGEGGEGEGGEGEGEGGEGEGGEGEADEVSSVASSSSESSLDDELPIHKSHVLPSRPHQRHMLACLEDSWKPVALGKDAERAYRLAMACVMLPLPLEDEGGGEGEAAKAVEAAKDCLAGDMRMLRKAFCVSREDHDKLKPVAHGYNKHVQAELRGRLAHNTAQAELVRDEMGDEAVAEWKDLEIASVERLVHFTKKLKPVSRVEIVEILVTNTHEKASTTSGFCFANVAINDVQTKLNEFPSDHPHNPAVVCDVEAKEPKLGEERRLVISVFAADNIFQDALVASVQVDLAKLQQAGFHDQTLPLGPTPTPNALQGHYGYVHITVTTTLVEQSRGVKLANKTDVLPINKYDHAKLYKLTLLAFLGLPMTNKGEMGSKAILDSLRSRAGDLAELKRAANDAGEALAPLRATHDFVLQQLMVRFGVSPVESLLTHLEILLLHFHTSFAAASYQRNLASVVTKLIHTATNTPYGACMRPDTQYRYANSLAIVFDYNQRLLRHYKQLFSSEVAKRVLCPVLQVTCSLYGADLREFHEFLSNDFIRKSVRDRFQGVFERAMRRSSAVAASAGRRASYTEQVGTWFTAATHSELCSVVMRDLRSDIVHYHSAFPQDLDYINVVMVEYLNRYSQTFAQYLGQLDARTPQPPTPQHTALADAGDDSEGEGSEGGDGVESERDKLLVALFHCWVLFSYSHSALDVHSHQEKAKARLKEVVTNLPSARRGTLTKATLVVYLNSASGLVSPEKDAEDIDAFGKVSYEDQEHVSPTKYNTSRPVWDQRFEFRVRNLGAPKPVVIVLMDANASLFGHREQSELGRCVVDIQSLDHSQLLSGYPVPLELTLEDSPGATVRLTVHYEMEQPQIVEAMQQAGRRSNAEQLKRLLLQQRLPAHILQPVFSLWLHNLPLREWLQCQYHALLHDGEPAQRHKRCMAITRSAMCAVSELTTAFMGLCTGSARTIFPIAAWCEAGAARVFLVLVDVILEALQRALPYRDTPDMSRLGCCTHSPLSSANAHKQKKGEEREGGQGDEGAKSSGLSAEWAEALCHVNALTSCVKELATFQTVIKRIRQAHPPVSSPSTAPPRRGSTPHPHPQEGKEGKEEREGKEGAAAKPDGDHEGGSNGNKEQQEAGDGAKGSKKQGGGGDGVVNERRKRPRQSLVARIFRRGKRAPSPESDEVCVVSQSAHPDIARALELEKQRAFEEGVEMRKQSGGGGGQAKGSHNDSDSSSSNGAAGTPPPLPTMPQLEQRVAATFRGVCHLLAAHLVDSLSPFIGNALASLAKEQPVGDNPSAEQLWQLVHDRLGMLGAVCVREAMQDVCQEAVAFLVGQFEARLTGGAALNPAQRAWVTAVLDVVQMRAGEGEFPVPMELILPLCANLRQLLMLSDMATPELCAVFMSVSLRGEPLPVWQILQVLQSRPEPEAQELVQDHIRACTASKLHHDLGLSEDCTVLTDSSGRVLAFPGLSQLGTPQQVVLTSKGVLVSTVAGCSSPLTVASTLFRAVGRMEKFVGRGGLASVRVLLVGSPGFTVHFADAAHSTDFSTALSRHCGDCEVSTVRSRVDPAPALDPSESRVACVSEQGSCGFAWVAGNALVFQRLVREKSAPSHSFPLDSHLELALVVSSDDTNAQVLVASGSNGITLCASRLTPAQAQRLVDTITQASPPQANHLVRKYTPSVGGARESLFQRLLDNNLSASERLIREVKCSIVRGLDVVTGTVALTSHRVVFKSPARSFRLEVRLQDVELISQEAQRVTGLRVLSLVPFAANFSEPVQLASIDSFVRFSKDLLQTWRQQRALASAEVIFVQ